MSKITLEYITGELKKLVPILPSGLTDYTINTLLSGGARYSVFNLMAYLQACQAYIVVYDMMDEEYKAEDVDGVHSLIQTLLDKYKIRLSVLNESIGITYTPPHNNASLSITTLIEVLNYMKCELKIAKDES